MNKNTIVALLCALALGIVLGSRLRCNTGLASAERVRSVLIRRDTSLVYLQRTDTLLKTVATYVPRPYRIEKAGPDTVAWHPACSDTRPAEFTFYADTLRRANEFKAVITDTVLGRILGRSVQWADLSPTALKTVNTTLRTEKKSAFLKLYAGADAGAGTYGPKYSLDLAPAISAVFADRYMVDAGYYVLNRQATLGLKVKLSFRK